MRALSVSQIPCQGSRAGCPDRVAWAGILSHGLILKLDAQAKRTSAYLHSNIFLKNAVAV